MPFRDSPHQEIEILMSFIYTNLLKSNEHTKNFHSRKPNDNNFIIEFEDKKHLCGLTIS